MNIELKRLKKIHGFLLTSCCIIVFSGTVVRAQTFSYDFETDYQGWACDFTDYNVGDSALWNLSYKHDTMPQIRPVQYGIIMTGDNFSDDLFFFMKKHITGLSPNVAYTIAFSIDVVTRMPPDGMGASDLVLKAGATMIEPLKIVSSDMYRMNIDKSNQSQPGPDMDTLGHTIHSVPGSFFYHLVTMTNAGHLFRRTASPDGDLWLIVGAESAFESYAEFLVAKISATLSPLSTPIASKGAKINPSNIVVHSQQKVSAMACFKTQRGLHSNDAPVAIYSLTGSKVGNVLAGGLFSYKHSGIMITQIRRP